MLDLCAFWLGYILIICIPGPNLLLIASIASLRGWRAALAIISGLCTGTASLGLLVTMLDVVFTQPLKVSGLGPLFTGAMLGYVGLRIAVSISSTDRGELGTAQQHGVGEAGFWTGLWTGATNPITSAYFASQLLGGDHTLTAEVMPIIALVGTVVLGGTRHLLVALLFASVRVRRAVMVHERTVRHWLGSAFIGLALWCAWPGLIIVGPILAQHTLGVLVDAASPLWQRLVGIVGVAPLSRLMLAGGGAVAVYLMCLARVAGGRATAEDSASVRAVSMSQTLHDWHAFGQPGSRRPRPYKSYAPVMGRSKSA